MEGAFSSKCAGGMTLKLKVRTFLIFKLPDLTFLSTETEECFKPMKLSNGHKDYELDPNSGVGIRIIPVQLPPQHTCDKCVFRWHWKSGKDILKMLVLIC